MSHTPHPPEQNERLSIALAWAALWLMLAIAPTAIVWGFYL